MAVLEKSMVEARAGEATETAAAKDPGAEGRSGH